MIWEVTCDLRTLIWFCRIAIKSLQIPQSSESPTFISQKKTQEVHQATQPIKS